MRQDQFEKLQALEERLTDIFLGEAEPDKWPGHGIEPRNMDAKTRGDRYWVKKNAVATLSLIQRVGSMVNRSLPREGEGAPPATPDGDEPQEEALLDSEIHEAEKEAARLMRQLQGAGKAAFDKKTHGGKA